AGDIILPSDGIDVIYLILTSEEGCEIVEELEIILSSAIDYMVDIPSPICDSLILPPITPSTGAVAYYSATQGMGTQFLPGDIIYAPFDGTLYVFDPTVDRSCASEDTLMLSIGFGPQPIFPSDTTSCDYVVLPEFGGTTGPNIRYSLLNSNFGSSDLYPGDTITINQQLYIHDTLGGCIFVDSMLINVIEPPFIGIDTSIIICQGFSSSLDLMSLLSNPDVGGLWSYPVIPDFDPLDSTVVDLSVLPLGNFTLTYGIESIECGLTTNRVFISVIEPPFGGVNAILDTCVNNQIFNFMSLLGDPDVGGEWSQVTGTDNVDISDSTSVSLNGITAGDYAFLYVIEGEATSEFCDAESASLFITVNPGPNAGEDNAATVCIGDVVDLSTLLSSDADPDGSYEGDGLFFSGTNWNTGAATPGQTYDISYILTSSSIDCPNDTAIIAVTVEEQLTAGDFLSDYMGCHGMTVDLNNYLNNASPGGYFTLGADFSEVVVDDMYTFDFDNNELISYIVEGFGSCPSDTIQFEFQVTDQPEITLDIINPSICSGNINDATILNFDATSGAETTVQIFDTNSGNLIYESTDYLIGLNNLFISPTGTPFEVLNDTLFVGNIGGNYNIVVNAVRGIMNCPMFEPLEGNIEVIQQYIEVIDVSLCEGDAYDFRGSTYLQSEVINVPSNFPGCDSLFNLNIENYDQVTGLVEGTFCIGDNIDVLNMTYATDTSYTETFSGIASFGCDSIVDIDISFQSVAVGAVNESLCENQNIIIEGETFDINNPTGQIDLPGGSVSGCDSLINVNISFINSVDFELISTICPGESVIVGPDTYDETNLTGTTTLTGLAAGGCDSLVNVALTLLSHSMSEVNPTICATEEVVVNGSIYNFSNPTGQEILPNAEGCDSTINVDLQFYQEASFGLNQDICEDEEVVVGSDVYNQGNLNGTTTLANASSNGCDSTVNVNLNLVGASIFDLSSTLCPGESLQIGSETYDEANTSGTTVLTDASESGCDSIVNVILTYTSPLAELEPTILCPNESTGMLQVLSVEALSLPLTMVINNGTPLTVTNLPFETQVNVGINDVLLTDNNGCFYNEMLEVMQITSGNISVTANQTSLNNYQLGVNADFPIIEYQWSPNQELSCDMCSDPGAVITETTQIDVTVTSDNGCTFTESVILEYTTPPVITKHFLANSIDLANPPNDIFFVQTNDDNAMVMEMMIFDRWGNKVFGVENVPPNDASVGWDGRMNDRKVNQGVYVYTIIMLSLSGEEEILVGNVTVFR
ncbi:MAG: gliding motility-associated C-terminal domain-containing protein, partial [Bacteroidia bacterium]|nr:gliding motility-associated C-terminal domain-containing protein [Bacteroidia bacterium]